jgi:hypothetical protein
MAPTSGPRCTSRVVDGLVGVRQLHELIVEHAAEPEQVAVGIETDRGLLVKVLPAADYQIYAVSSWRVAATAIAAPRLGPVAAARGARRFPPRIRTTPSGLSRYTQRSLAPSKQQEPRSSLWTWKADVVASGSGSTCGADHERRLRAAAGQHPDRLRAINRQPIVGSEIVYVVVPTRLAARGSGEIPAP